MGDNIKITFAIEMQASSDKIIVEKLNTGDIPLDLGFDISSAVKSAVKDYFKKKGGRKI